jgi:hypothetical protein
MTASELLDLAWSYPLFEALYGRGSRRFGTAALRWSRAWPLSLQVHARRFLGANWRKRCWSANQAMLTLRTIKADAVAPSRSLNRGSRRSA